MWMSRHRHLPLVVVIILIALAGAGCGRPQVAQSPAGNSRAGLSADARLVASGTDEFVLSGNSLYGLRAGTLVKVAALAPPQGSAVRAVAFDGANGAMVASNGALLTMFSSSDIGHTWKQIGSKSLAQEAPDGLGDVDIAVANGRTVVLADEPSGSNFSSALVLTSAGTTGDWVLGRAPSAGTLFAADGLFWLVGGVEHNQVFVSEDGAQWMPTKLPVSAPSWSAGPGAAGPGGGAIIPVTVHKPGAASTVSLLRTTDHGLTWSLVASVALSVHTEVGITAPVAVSPGGSWVIVQADGARVFRGDGADPASIQTISPNGLPAGVGQVAFPSSTDGLALAGVSVCPAGKNSCATSMAAFRTLDGGQTWGPLSVG